MSARDEQAHVVGAVLVDPARAVEPQHLPGRGGGDHHIADVVDRGDQTRQLDDVGAVAMEDQDGPGVDRSPGARDRLEGDVPGRAVPDDADLPVCRAVGGFVNEFDGSESGAAMQVSEAVFNNTGVGNGMRIGYDTGGVKEAVIGAVIGGDVDGALMMARGSGPSGPVVKSAVGRGVSSEGVAAGAVAAGRGGEMATSRAGHGNERV
jgi:hypothetical protein